MPLSFALTIDNRHPILSVDQLMSLLDVVGREKIKSYYDNGVNHDETKDEYVDIILHSDQDITHVCMIADDYFDWCEKECVMETFPNAVIRTPEDFT